MRPDVRVGNTPKMSWEALATCSRLFNGIPGDAEQTSLGHDGNVINIECGHENAYEKLGYMSGTIIVVDTRQSSFENTI